MPNSVFVCSEEGDCLNLVGIQVHRLHVVVVRTSYLLVDLIYRYHLPPQHSQNPILTTKAPFKPENTLQGLTHGIHGSGVSRLRAVIVYASMSSTSAAG